MYQPNPPQLPPGWIALWDEASQRYYYVDQATGTTQWEIPTGAPVEATRGEASSYGSGFPQAQNYTTYPSQPGESGGYNGSSAPGYPSQQPYGGQQQPGMPGDGGLEGERGLGKMLTSPVGTALTGSLIGFAAGKYFGGKHNQHQGGGNQQHGGYGNYGPPPPPAGGVPGYNPPFPSNWGGGYDKPPKKFGFF